MAGQERGKRTHFGMGIPVANPGGLNSVINGFSKAQAQMGLEVSVIDSIRGRNFARKNLWESTSDELTEYQFAGQPYSVGHFHFTYTAAQLRLFHPSIYSNFDLKIFHFHGPWKLESKIAGQDGARLEIKGLIEKYVYNQFDHFWTASAAFSRLLARDFGVSPERIANTGLGIDTDFFTRSPLSKLKDKEVFTVGTVRRLEKRMGLENLIIAVAAMPEVHLRIVGDGSISSELRALSNSLGVEDRVTFLGRVPDEALPIFYSEIDVCVIPTVALEGFCVTALESFSCGTPVLASNLDGLVESVGGMSKNLLFEPNSSEAIIDSLNAFRENNAITIAQCREYAEQFSWISKTKSLEASMQKMVSK